MKHNGIPIHPPEAPFQPALAIPENSRLKTIASGTAEVFKLDPRLIQREHGFNPRYDFGDILALAEDILENGVLEALKVRKDGINVFLVNGDRRLTAVQQLITNNLWPADPANPGYPMPIPCTSEGIRVKPLDRLFMMLSLNTGKPFTLLEKGLAYQQILATDPEINASEIARRSGETKQAVSNALQIVTHASPTLIQHIKAEALSASTALDIIKSTAGHDEQDAAAATALAAAKESGRTHATPKDLPAKKDKPAKPPKETPHDNSIAADADADADPTDGAFIADLNEDEDESDAPDQPDPSNSPADPAAYARLKNAPSSNRDGSSGGPGEGFASPDKRLKNIQKALDEMDKDQCVPDRWDTVEMVLDYLDGCHTLKTLKDHLKKL